MDELTGKKLDSALGLRMRLAYEKHLPRFLAMSPKEVVQISVDIPEVYTRTVWKLQELGPLRHQAESLPFMNMQVLQHLDEYLLALGYAQAQYCTRVIPPAEVRLAYEELKKLRVNLAADMEALIRRGLIPAERSVKLKWPASRGRVGFDVLGMVSVFRTHWAQIQGRTAITQAELAAADALADRLLTAVGERNQAAVTMAIHVRLAAFTLFERAYDQLRRGVIHIRWEEKDLEKFLPSVWGKRKGRGRRVKKKRVKPPSDLPVPATPVAAVALGAVTPAKDHDGAPSPYP